MSTLASSVLSTHTRSTSMLMSVGVALSSLGCEPQASTQLTLTQRAHPLVAYCEAQVTGVGARAIETDYLPHVVACENGAASFEALKAQAVAARSYLYYKLDQGGGIEDGQSDQVYTCSRPPLPQHFEAVAQTSGQVLLYQGAQVAAFYVAGAIPSDPSCVALESDPDPYNTERYVTYNEGLSGDALTQTPLGWVNPNNLANRGCQSQNGADCLSDQGWGYEDILRFYYGADIELVSAEGECVSAPLPEPSEAGETGEAGEAQQGGEEPLGGQGQAGASGGGTAPNDGLMGGAGAVGGAPYGGEEPPVAGASTPVEPPSAEDPPPSAPPPATPAEPLPIAGEELSAGEELGAGSPSSGGAAGCDAQRSAPPPLYLLLLGLLSARRWGRQAHAKS